MFDRRTRGNDRERCWLCEARFPSVSSLNNHLISAAHRRLAVICPYCARQERTFTRIQDLEIHATTVHTDIAVTKEIYSKANGFYYAKFPEDYARIVDEIEPYYSTIASEARNAIRKWTEGFSNHQERVSEWNRGWKMGMDLFKRRVMGDNRKCNGSKRAISRSQCIENGVSTGKGRAGEAFSDSGRGEGGSGDVVRDRGGVVLSEDRADFGRDRDRFGDGVMNDDRSRADRNVARRNRDDSDRGRTVEDSTRLGMEKYDNGKGRGNMSTGTRYREYTRDDKRDEKRRSDKSSGTIYREDRRDYDRGENDKGRGDGSSGTRYRDKSRYDERGENDKGTGDRRSGGRRKDDEKITEDMVGSDRRGNEVKGNRCSEDRREDERGNDDKEVASVNRERMECEKYGDETEHGLNSRKHEQSKVDRIDDEKIRGTEGYIGTKLKESKKRDRSDDKNVSKRRREEEEEGFANYEDDIVLGEEAETLRATTVLKRLNPENRSQSPRSSISCSTNTSSITVNNEFQCRAQAILRKGYMPLCPPARRDWKNGHVSIEDNGMTLQWPPPNWREMTPDQKTLAREFISIYFEKSINKDTLGSNFPMLSRTTLLDKYNFLTLDGEAKTPHEKTAGGRSLFKIRYYNYSYIKAIAVGEVEESRMSRGILSSVEAANRWKDTDILARLIDDSGIKMSL